MSTLLRISINVDAPNKNIPEACISFTPIYIKYIIEHKTDILKYIKSLVKKIGKKTTIHIGIYNFKCTIDYKSLYKTIKDTFKKYN